MPKLKELPPPHPEVEERLTTLQAAWTVYGQVFKSEANIDLLNRQVPSMAWLLQWMLIDTVILGICRLVERGKSVTLPALVSSLRVLATQDEYKGLVELLNGITTAVKPLKQHRNTRIAHNAQQLAQRPDDALPKLTRKQIQDTIDQIVGLMNRISELYLDHETYYIPDMMGDGDGLIQCVRLAERLHQLQDDAWGTQMTDQEVIEKLRNRGDYE
jgi:hypothetical protein